MTHEALLGLLSEMDVVIQEDKVDYSGEIYFISIEIIIYLSLGLCAVIALTSEPEVKEAKRLDM